MNLAIKDTIHWIREKISENTRSTLPYPKCTFKHVDPMDYPDRTMLMFIDIYNKCNLRCTMCFYPGVADDPEQTIELDDFEQVANIFFPKSRQINLSCVYEPFMHRGFFDYLAITLGHKPPKEVRMVTNATLLTRSRAEELIKLGIPQINISIDGATKETYETIRLRGNFDHLMKNLHNLAALKEELGTTIPKLQFQFVIMANNYHEIPELVRELSQFKPFKFVFIHQDLHKPAAEYRAKIETALRTALAECVANDFLFEEVPPHCLSFEEIIEAYGGPVEDAPKFMPGCLDPWNFLKIEPDGNVFMCPTIREPAGNIFQNDILDIWNGEDYYRLREQWNKNTPPPICQTCPYYNIGLVQLRRVQDQMNELLTRYIFLANRQIEAPHPR